MPKLPADPLAGTDRLLVDGTNLLHTVRRMTGGGRRGGAARDIDDGELGGAARDGGAPPAPAAAAPAAALIGRLRGAVPAQVGIELVLDGSPDPGMRNARVASGLIVRYSGRRSADQLLLAIVDDAARALAGSRAERRAGVDNILVVTDDRDLRSALEARGARTAGSRWLLGRLDRQRLEGSSVGNRRPPKPPRPEPDPDRRGWSPGRGATTKHGNPKRGHQPP